MTYLRALASEQKLLEIAYQSCQYALEQSAEEDRAMGEVPLRGWDIRTIQRAFQRHALIFSHGILTEPYIETSIILYHDDATGTFLRNQHVFGSYRLITTLDGTIEDDYLVIERSPEEA